MNIFRGLLTAILFTSPSSREVWPDAIINTAERCLCRALATRAWGEKLPVAQSIPGFIGRTPLIHLVSWRDCSMQYDVCRNNTLSAAAARRLRISKNMIISVTDVPVSNTAFRLAQVFAAFSSIWFGVCHYVTICHTTNLCHYRPMILRPNNDTNLYVSTLKDEICFCPPLSLLACTHSTSSWF